MEPGPLNLITDVAGLRVGNAQDARVKSGVTVLTRIASTSSAARPASAARPIATYKFSAGSRSSSPISRPSSSISAISSSSPSPCLR